jgi:hypothetical protein
MPRINLQAEEQEEFKQTLKEDFDIGKDIYCLFQWPHGLRRRPWTRGSWDRGFESCLSHGYVSCVGRGLCDELITRPKSPTECLQWIKETSLVWGVQAFSNTVKPRREEVKILIALSVKKFIVITFITAVIHLQNANQLNEIHAHIFRPRCLPRNMSTVRLNASLSFTCYAESNELSLLRPTRNIPAMIDFFFLFFLSKRT